MFIFYTIPHAGPYKTFVLEIVDSYELSPSSTEELSKLLGMFMQ